MVEANARTFRERLSRGQVVYITEPNSLITGISDSEIVVKKGTIIEAQKWRHYPVVAIWSDISTDPKSGLSVCRSPMEIFTIEEMRRFINRQKELAGFEIDTLIQNAKANRTLAYMMIGASTERLGNDLIRNPQDPEF